jgi:hypothetical protein
MTLDGARLPTSSGRWPHRSDPPGGDETDPPGGGETDPPDGGETDPLRGWGDNDAGQGGDGPDTSTPSSVEELEGVTSVATSIYIRNYHGLAVGRSAV